MFAFIIILSLSIALSLLISQPFNGALIRLRANYLPKAISLSLESDDTDPERGAAGRSALAAGRSAAKIGPVVPGIFAMLMRTRRLEGWAGVYKGSAPVVAQLLVVSLASSLFFAGASASAHGQYKAAPSGPDAFGFWKNLFFMGFMALVALPLNVITHRCIVHPRMLPLNTPMANLRELLSYSEYAQPWRLYLLPGLLPATLAHTAWIGLVTRLVRHITVPALGGLPAPTPATDGQTHYSGPSSAGGTLEVSSIGLAVFVIWNILSVGVLAPLECVMVRLSTQRPEKQQPLHLAYGARRNAASPARGGAPAPYSHQATAAAQAQPGGAYSDAAPASAPAQPDKPLPAEPPGRASFAIEDDDEAEGEGEGEGGRGGEGASASEASKPLAPVSTSESTPAPAPSAASATPAPAPAASTQPTTEAPHRVLGARAASSDVLPPYTPQAVGPGMGLGYNAEPPEPVIALRPCDEPASSAEAAAAAAEGFGAPTVERYQGLVHCLNTMVEEEGLESLARGAWVTLLGALAGNFL